MSGEGDNKNLSSLVQRQSERQGIFLIALSPLERGAGGVKYQLYLERLNGKIELLLISLKDNVIY